MARRDGVEGQGLFELVEAWSGLGVVVRHDHPTGTWIFIALHDDALGRPTGGCRMRVYETPEDGLRDALRLAEGMTQKWAAVDLPFGGGKSVLAVPGPITGRDREGLLVRFAELLNTLRGAYGTGEDLGTTPEDMQLMGRVSPHVMVAHPVTGETMDPGPHTARGVVAGIRAALEDRTGSPSLEGRTVLVQGAGDVGAPLARMVASAGGRVLVADVDGARAEALARDVGGRVVSVGSVYETECDVYAPCAVGGVLSRGSIPRLRCRIVAGSANNQLDRPEDAERLKERGVLYAPDFVINAGGAVAFGLLSTGTTDPEELGHRIDAVGATLSEIFEEAHERGESPVQAARRRVERTLERARAARDAETCSRVS